MGDRASGQRVGRLSSRRMFIAQAAAFGAITVLEGCASGGTESRIRTIGYLSGNARASVEALSAPFRQQLAALGYIEGGNIVIEFRIAENVVDRLPAMAAELVALPADVILAEAIPAQLAAKQATATIPIVFVLSTDPVGQGLVASLARPGRNITGVSTASEAITAKQLEILKETIPAMARVVVLWNANNVAMAALLRVIEATAQTLGVAVETIGVHGPDELDAALERIRAGRFDALLMLPALSVVRAPDHVPEFANKIGLPQMFSDMQFARAGGLMHFGVNFAALHRRAADYVDKILKGASPADLPVEQPTQFDLIVNVSTARRLGLMIPNSVLRRATELLQ